MSELSQLSSEADPRRAIAMLSSKPCTLVRSAYGDELVLGFGNLRPSHPPLEDQEADWMLYSRATPWVLESSMGVVLSSYRIKQLNDKNLDIIRDTIIDVSVTSTQFRNRALGLTIGFENGANFLFLPPEPTLGEFDPVQDAWQLVMPDQRIVTSNEDEQLTFISSSDLVPPITDPNELLELRAPELSSFGRRTAASSRSPEVTHSATVERLLTALITSSSYRVFVPASATSLDAMVVAPNGTIIGVEIKSAHDVIPELRSLQKQQGIRILTIVLVPDEAYKDRPWRDQVLGSRGLVSWSGGSVESIEAALGRLAVVGNH
jgi:hypothetical protein